jgi:lipopolysaccharide/colanic/teichoic acid biosynthesis glycosyltransferase
VAVEQIASAQRRPDRTTKDNDPCSLLSFSDPLSYVIGEQLFRDALLRERRRADRSHETLTLMLVKSDSNVLGEAGWKAAVDAVASAKRDTDILGWFKHHSTLGVILADVREPEPLVAAHIEARIRRELSARLGDAVTRTFSMELLAHVSVGDNKGLSPVQPLIEDISASRRRLNIYEGAKRSLDVVLAAALLMILAPVFFAIAAIVKLMSPGPVLFKQVRVGEKAAPFNMLKFRSMHVNSDHGIHQAFVTNLINGSERPKDEQKEVFKIVNDPRVTPIGRVLRKTSLDELPQLWNVLRGDMSLVGPRPPLPYEVEQYKPWHRRRVLDAKPGITGLWQVKGRSRTTFDGMVRLDLRHAKSRSLWADLKILLATPAAVIAGKGAC